MEVSSSRWLISPSLVASGRLWRCCCARFPGLEAQLPLPSRQEQLPDALLSAGTSNAPCFIPFTLISYDALDAPTHYTLYRYRSTIHHGRGGSSGGAGGAPSPWSLWQVTQLRSVEDQGKLILGLDAVLFFFLFFIFYFFYNDAVLFGGGTSETTAVSQKLTYRPRSALRSVAYFDVGLVRIQMCVAWSLLS